MSIEEAALLNEQRAIVAAALAWDASELPLSREGERLHAVLVLYRMGHES